VNTAAHDRTPRRTDEPWTVGRGLVRSRLRRVALVRLPLTVLAAALLGAFIDTRHGYLLAFAGIGGLSLTSTVVLSWLVAHRAHPAERSIWQAWFVGMAGCWAVGVALAVTELTGADGWQRWGPVVVPIVAVPFFVSHHNVFRARSGARGAFLDIAEATTAIVLVLAPVVPVVSEVVRSADDRPWTIGAAQVMLLSLASTCSLTMIYLRLERGKRRLEGIGLTASAATAATAAAQMWMGASGFTAPASVGLALHALGLGTVALVPLYVTCEHKTGFRHLAPEEQIRTGAAVARWSLLSMPILLGVVVLMHDHTPWVGPYALGVLAGLVVVGAVRQAQTAKENRRLYAAVAEGAAERRRLVADVMRSMEHERHRLAGALHEQAASAYAVLVTFIASTGSRTDGGEWPDQHRHVADSLRDDLRQQAESLRHLSLALQPLDPVGGDQHDLVAPIAGCVDSLYGDDAPVLTVDVHPDLHLDWTTRVLVFRIVEEALRNVWRHADARQIVVAVAPDHRGLQLSIADDGVGFDPSTTLFESGLDSMRNLAGLGGGRVTIDAERGGGTQVTVRELGTVRHAASPTGGDPLGPSPRALRLLRSDRPDPS
jgi:signal transduction histidine kinase